MNNKNLKYLFLTALLISILNAGAQSNSGYLGKRNAIEAGINMYPIGFILEQTANTKITMGRHFEFKAIRAVSDLVMLTAGYSNFNTSTFADKISNYNEGFLSVYHRYSLGFNKIHRKKGGIAPIGKQFTYDFYLQREYLRDYYAIKYLDAPKNGLKFRLKPGFSFGYCNSRILSKFSYIKTGIKINIFFPSSEKRATTAIEYIRAQNSNALFNSGIISFNVALGLLY